MNMKGKKEGETKKDYDIAYDFATKAYKKFRDVIKAIVLFGSAAKQEIKLSSDIDIVVLIDDCTVNWDDELIAWYREELAKLIAKQPYAKQMHVNTVTLSTFWDEVREGEPLAINVIRYGQPLIDIGGFFDPLKVLLAKGRIRPSPEAVFVTMQRAAGHLENAKRNQFAAVEGFYWAMVDAAHSALMAVGVTPPSPEHLPELMTRHLVNTRKLDKKYVLYYDYARKTAKEAAYGNIKRIPGKQIEELQEKTEQFVRYFRDLTIILIKDKKIIRTEIKP